jgi:hypothetical protein
MYMGKGWKRGYAWRYKRECTIYDECQRKYGRHWETMKNHRQVSWKMFT